MSSVWPILHYDDTRAALRFLVDVLGFRESLAVPDGNGDIVHAELRWHSGGALVFGSTKHTDSVHGHLRTGSSAAVRDHRRRRCRPRESPAGGRGRR